MTLIINVSDPTKSNAEALRQESLKLHSTCEFAIALGCKSVQIKAGDLAPPPFDPVKVLLLLKVGQN